MASIVLIFIVEILFLLRLIRYEISSSRSFKIAIEAASIAVLAVVNVQITDSAP